MSPETPPEVAVAVEGATKTFGSGAERIHALRSLTVSIRRGGVTGLVGPDGSGKTTLLRVIAGLLVPDAGRVAVLGLQVTAQPEAVRRRLGYMPQRFGLYEDLTVDENLTLYADMHGVPPSERSGRFGELLQFTGLGPFRDRLAGKLSGGMKQKLGLACTLVRPPEVLLLDEPSVGVDPVSRRELWQIVQRLAGGGMSVVWSTAYLDEAERCDEVVVLHHGQLLGQAPPGDFLAPVRGRTFVLRVPPERRRSTAQRAREAPGVLDAVVQGRAVRLLLAAGSAPPRVSALVAPDAAEEAELVAVEPRFEDAVIDLLHERSTGGNGEGRAPPKISDVARPTRGDGRPPAPHAVIETQALTRLFGDFRAVDGISLSVAEGETFGLLGPNGAGKSTTFKMLCGLLPPSSGQALVLGIDLRRGAAAARARIGYMSQKFALYGPLSVVENLRFFASAYGLSGRALRVRIDRMLGEFGLGPYAGRASEELPLGYKQRLSLACALLHQPDILFLDEPTSGVDPITRREFWARINAMAESGVTVMVTTHFLDEAEYCDRLGIVYRGRLIALGSSDELKAHAQSAALPDPTLDDAFVDLIEEYEREHPA